MREQYQKEISQIHVPAELLEKTKLAMKAEKERILAETRQTEERQAEQVSLTEDKTEKKGKVVPFRRLSMVAAAVILLLVAVPAVSGAMKESSVDGQDTQLYLAQKEEVELHTIEQEENWFEELVEKIKAFFD